MASIVSLVQCVVHNVAGLKGRTWQSLLNLGAALGTSRSRRRHERTLNPESTRSRDYRPSMGMETPPPAKRAAPGFSVSDLWDLPGTSLSIRDEKVLVPDVPPVRLRSVTAISPLSSPLSHTLDHALELLMNTSLYDFITHIDASNSASDLASHHAAFVGHTAMRCCVSCRSTCDRVR